MVYGGPRRGSSSVLDRKGARARARRNQAPGTPVGGRTLCLRHRHGREGVLVATLQDLSQRMVGLALRPERCKWGKVRRHDGPDDGLDPSAQGPTPLANSTQQARAGERLQVLGAQVQVDGKHRD